MPLLGIAAGVTPLPEVYLEDFHYKEYQKWAAGIAASMDDHILAAQVIMTGIDGKVSLNKSMRTLLKNSPPGAIMLFKYNLDADKDKVRLFLEECVSSIVTAISEGTTIIPRIIPFIAVDHEGGMVHRFGPGVNRLPAPASFWDTAKIQGKGIVLRMIEETAETSGREIRELGITMNLAPVAEIVDPENYLFLETRSYGPDPDFTEAAVSAFIRGMEAAGIACVVKHFPGNTGDDPHNRRVVLTANREMLDHMVKPFVGIIQSLHVPAIMVSHIVVSAWDQERNASLSPRIIRDWLRGNLGFTGIIVADDFSMNAVAALGINNGVAAVEALNAGVDIVMAWPRNLASVHRAIFTALQDGRLSRERLQEAVTRILFEKIRYGIIEMD